jgi:hypothetical protein
MRLSIFILFAALFVATTAGHIYTIDSYLNYSVTKSLASHGTVRVPRTMMAVEGKDGRHYSKLGIGQSLIGLPFYWIGSLFERIRPGTPIFRAYSREFKIPYESEVVTAEAQTLIRVSDEEGARVFFTALTNAFVAAGVCLILWMLLTEYGLSPRAALLGTSVLALSTPLWIYSRDLFADPLFAGCLIGIFWLLKDPPARRGRRKLMLAGGLASLGILTRLSFLPVVAIFAAYLVLASRDRAEGIRGAMVFAAGSLPGIAVVALLNLHRFGGITLTGYHTAFDKGFSIPLLKGLWWNLASPYRSVLLYAPPVLLFITGFAAFSKRHRSHLWLMTALVVYTFGVYSRWWAWHGGWCWGPRFLVPVIPLLVIPGLAAVEQSGRWLRVLTVALGVAGFAVQLGAVLINYTAVYDYWIKTGRLDWAEAGIQSFSPVTTHLRAALATHPAQYDLWIIQAWRVSPGGCVLTLVILAATLGFAGRHLLMRQRRGASTS